MPHGMSWFHFLPGFDNLQEYVRAAGGKTWIQQSMIGIQHVLAAVLVLIVLFALSLRARAQLAAAKDGGVVPDPHFSARNFVEVISQAVYNQLYALYRQVHDAFGGLKKDADLSRVMKDLLAIKHAQRA